MTNKENRYGWALIGVLCALILTTAVMAQGAAAGNPALMENMAKMPAGKYSIGAPDADYYAREESKPLHLVELSAYSIDKYEVTIRAYKKCVEAGVCAEPTLLSSQTRKNYYSDAYGAYPVVNVTWEDAKNYCEFVGKRLPTEAEWERAGMGIDGYRKFPWGDFLPRPYQANTSGVPGDTEIGNGYPSGASSSGVVDMMGNVAEWVSDWYDPGYYAVSEKKDPAGPADGTEKVVRGASFASNYAQEHLTNRGHLSPTESSPMIGFRCAMDTQAATPYDGLFVPTESPDQSYGFVQSGQREGIFILKNPGADQTLECIAANGSILTVYEGPIERDYTFWIRVSTKNGCRGWTLASSVLNLQW